MIRYLKSLLPKRITAIIFINEPAKNKEVQLPDGLKIEVYDTKKLSGINKIDSKLKHNNKCYAVFDEKGVLAHQSWIFKFKLLTWQLGFRNVLTIGNCVTTSSFKGKGIYPCVLQRIQKNYAPSKIVIYCDPLNIASIRGIEKAGFTKMYQFSMKRILGIKISLQKNEY
jgi:hypothetical protein